MSVREIYEKRNSDNQPPGHCHFKMTIVYFSINPRVTCHCLSILVDEPMRDHEEFIKMSGDYTLSFRHPVK